MLADAAAWPACPAPGLQAAEGKGVGKGRGRVKERGKGGRKDDGKREEKNAQMWCRETERKKGSGRISEKIETKWTTRGFRHS